MKDEDGNEVVGNDGSSCRRFADRLDDLIAGRLSAEQRRAAERHLRGCPSCRTLERVMRDDLPPSELDVPSDLVAGVLRETVGSACTRCRTELCAFVDGELDPVGDELMRLHVETCGDCRALRTALERLGGDLPAMALVSPGRTFAEGVLRATRARRLRPVREPIDTWLRLLLRPRLSWEVAYVGAMLLWLIFGLPLSPVHELPRRALEGVRGERLSASLQTLWTATGGRGVGKLERAKDTLASKLERTTDTRDELKRHGAELTDAALTLDLSRGVRAARELGDDAGELVSRLLREEPSNGDGVARPEAERRSP